MTNTWWTILLDLLGVTDRQAIKHLHLPDQFHSKNKDDGRVCFWCDHCNYFHTAPASLVARDVLSKLPITQCELLSHRKMAVRIIFTNLTPHVIK